jgi:hypothetical protein
MFVGVGAVGIATITEDTPPPLTHSLLVNFAGKHTHNTDPAFHLNHFQLFHNITFLRGLATALFNSDKWKAYEPSVEFITGSAVLGWVRNLSHLLCNVTKAKGLPLVGKLLKNKR